MPQWFFDAPAKVNDFTVPERWHDQMVREAEEIVTLLVAAALGKNPEQVTEQDVMSVAPTLTYVNPTRTSPPPHAETVGIAPWGAFPRAVERKAPWPLPSDPDDITGVYRAAEHLGEEDHRSGIFRDFDGNPLTLPARDRQDEYLEWVVRRSSAGKITKAIFVAEGYDYFSALFLNDEQRTVELYREFTGISSITADDLRASKGLKRHFSNGGFSIVAPVGHFNPRNRFNVEPGIVHLSHRANSLGAEVNLAGVSGIARKNVKGATLSAGDAEMLLCCSQGGNPNRNSDPLIGEQAYSQVLSGKHYTLANPVGLYIAGVESDRLTLESGEPVPREWWRVVRGEELWDSTKSRVLRLELEVPATEGIVLGDLHVDGNPIKYGGQLAKLLSVHLFVTRWQRQGNGVGPIVSCDATCCKKNDTEEKVLSDGSCATGYSIAYPDLIPGPRPGPLSFVALDAGMVPRRRGQDQSSKTRLP